MVGLVACILFISATLYTGIRTYNYNGEQKTMAWLKDKDPKDIQSTASPFGASMPVDEICNSETLNASTFPLYRTYIIRCWRETTGQDAQEVLRFTLDIPSTGQRFGFTSMEALSEALHAAILVSNKYQTEMQPSDHRDD